MRTVGVCIEYGKRRLSSVTTVKCCFPSFVFLDRCREVSDRRKDKTARLKMFSKGVKQQSDSLLLEHLANRLSLYSPICLILNQLFANKLFLHMVGFTSISLKDVNHRARPSP